MGGKVSDEVRWARRALDVQDACNMSGVVHALARIMGEMCRAGLDTGARNRHPVSVLFVDKLKSLSGDDFVWAYEECMRHAGRKNDSEG